jgi:hypothetical protein
VRPRRAVRFARLIHAARLRSWRTFGPRRLRRRSELAWLPPRVTRACPGLRVRPLDRSGPAAAANPMPAPLVGCWSSPPWGEHASGGHGTADASWSTADQASSSRGRRARAASAGAGPADRSGVPLAGWWASAGDRVPQPHLAAGHAGGGLAWASHPRPSAHGSGAVDRCRRLAEGGRGPGRAHVHQLRPRPIRPPVPGVGGCAVRPPGRFAPFEGYVAFSLTAATAFAILLKHEDSERGGELA